MIEIIIVAIILLFWLISAIGNKSEQEMNSIFESHEKKSTSLVKTNSLLVDNTDINNPTLP
jgi:hypothetical protein